MEECSVTSIPQPARFEPPLLQRGPFSAILHLSRALQRIFSAVSGKNTTSKDWIGRSLSTTSLSLWEKLRPFTRSEMEMEGQLDCSSTSYRYMRVLTSTGRWSTRTDC